MKRLPSLEAFTPAQHFIAILVLTLTLLKTQSIILPVQCRLAIPMCDTEPGDVGQQLELFHWWNAYAENEIYKPQSTASRMPIHEGGFVWGRSGHQWIQSIIAYLAWREGSSWRPPTHRYNPVRWHFVECISIVQSAYYGNAKWLAASAARHEVDRCPVCRKKPPQSVKLQRAQVSA